MSCYIPPSATDVRTRIKDERLIDASITSLMTETPSLALRESSMSGYKFRCVLALAGTE